MQMLYNSDSYAVVMFDMTADASIGGSADSPSRGGYEIVDKFARKEIFIDGALAQSFKEGVEALIETEPSEEEIDEYLARFTSLMHQPVVLH
ncbi:BTH_I0359 family protein [Piscinibacter sp.]|uniref:BTH_I0359 family protein n=1 Tax=Piscinibacter sp. TaxID=1903157 RepID=UPI002F4032E2